ncbi:hypothetical protein LguiA_018261 [Lonicera macranthoides]
MDISRHFKSYISSHNKFYSIDTNNYTHKRKNKKKSKKEPPAQKKAKNLKKMLYFFREKCYR